MFRTVFFASAMLVAVSSIPVNSMSDYGLSHRDLDYNDDECHCDSRREPSLMDIM